MTQPLLDFKAACEHLAKKDGRFQIKRVGMFFFLYGDGKVVIRFLGDKPFYATQDPLDLLTAMLGWTIWVEPSTSEPGKWMSLGRRESDGTVWPFFVGHDTKLDGHLSAAIQIIYKKYPRNGTE